MSQIFEKINSFIDKNEDCILCIIGATKGATPRKSTSKMIVTKNGDIFGSVGGGAVESSAIEKAKSLFSSKICACETFKLNGNKPNKRMQETGMVCGGQVTIIFVYIDTSNAETHKLDRNLKDDFFFSCKICGDKLDHYNFNFELDSNRALLNSEDETFENIVAKIDKFGNYFKCKDGVVTYIEKITPPSRTIIFGAGHISGALAPIMKYLGYEVIVYDPRDYLFENPAFDNIDKKIIAEFSDIEDELGINSSDNIVVVTPSHSNDFDVLLFALRSQAKYIGCLGSVKKTAVINKKLEDANFSAEDIKRIDSPIGINIGAQTPREIAISIAAKIIDCNNVRKNW